MIVAVTNKSSLPPKKLSIRVGIARPIFKPLYAVNFARLVFSVLGIAMKKFTKGGNKKVDHNQGGTHEI